MSKSKTDNPHGFYKYIKPSFHGIKPTKMVTVAERISERTVYDGEVLYVDADGNNVKIEFELDYSGCYYEGDTPSIEAKIVTEKVTEIPNKNYDKQLSIFEKEKEKYAKLMIEYKEWLAKRK
jgi:hypothetical protein